MADYHLVSRGGMVQRNKAASLSAIGGKKKRLGRLLELTKNMKTLNLRRLPKRSSQLHAVHCPRRKGLVPAISFTYGGRGVFVLLACMWL